MPRITKRGGDESGVIVKNLVGLVSDIPLSTEPASANPKKRADAIAEKAARTAGICAGALAAPPGPLGFATIIPDLIAVWRIQRGMVADIAAAYGKTSALQKEAMIYCLFKHGGAAAMRDLVVRVGQRYLVRRASLRLIQQLLEKVGVRVTQRLIGKGIARWVPVAGAVGVGAYAYYDTKKVATTAIELFSRDVELEDGTSA